VSAVVGNESDRKAVGTDVAARASMYSVGLSPFASLDHLQSAGRVKILHSANRTLHYCGPWSKFTSTLCAFHFCDTLQWLIIYVTLLRYPNTSPSGVIYQACSSTPQYQSPQQFDMPSLIHFKGIIGPQYLKRSSAAAKGPRDALCQLTSCQLLYIAVRKMTFEKYCTTLNAPRDHR